MTLGGDMSVNSVAVLKRDMAWEVLLSCGSIQLRAQGCSMFPTVRRGDVLVIEQASLQSVKVGDVVVTAGESGLVSHRVVAVGKDAEGGLLITRGDTSAVDDLPVPESDLLGRVGFVIRNGDRISVPSHLSAIDGAVARTFRRLLPAVRPFMEMRRRLQNGFRTPKEPIAQCQS